MSFNKNRIRVARHQILGSVPFVPSVAGLIIASEVVYDLIQTRGQIRHTGTLISKK